MSDPTEEQVIEIDPNNNYTLVTRTVSRRPINPEAALSRLASERRELALITPDIGNDTFFFFFGEGPGEFLYIKNLTELRITNVNMMISETTDDQVLLRPVFGNRSGIPTGNIYTYTPPEDQRMLLLLSPTGIMYFMFQCKLSGQTYQPYFPNIYEGGNVCLGQVNAPSYNLYKYKDRWVEEFLDRWETAEWNSDLIEFAGTYSEALKFDDATKKNILPSGDWRDLTIGVRAMPSCYNRAAEQIHAVLGPS